MSWSGKLKKGIGQSLLKVIKKARNRDQVGKIPRNFVFGISDGYSYTETESHVQLFWGFGESILPHSGVPRSSHEMALRYRIRSTLALSRRKQTKGCERVGFFTL